MTGNHLLFGAFKHINLWDINNLTGNLLPHLLAPHALCSAQQVRQSTLKSSDHGDPGRGPPQSRGPPPPKKKEEKEYIFYSNRQRDSSKGGGKHKNSTTRPTSRYVSSCIFLDILGAGVGCRYSPTLHIPHAFSRSRGRFSPGSLSSLPN